MITVKNKGLEDVLVHLGELSAEIERSARFAPICEIRLRAGKPVVLERMGCRETLSYTVTQRNLEEYVSSFCRFSLHSYEREFREGFITIRGGHRVGFCGTAVIKNGKCENVREISSLNIRIACEFKGAASPLAETVLSERTKGMLLAGPPLSGKTTFLRDLCRIVGGKRKLSIIDCRNEIAAVYHGMPQNDVGVNTDVLCGYSMRDGILSALRTFSPEYIACDEVTGDSETIGQCVSCGVKLIFTAHCADMAAAREMARIGGISDIVLLSHGKIIAMERL